jgi:hypothetical protein
MTESASDNEYHVGGSLPVDALSYVTRQADSEFYQSLRAGEFCYILNSRQMGKSSLRVRTMQRLQAEGFICAFIDLTGIGKEDVTAEKWYAGIVQSLVSSCHLSKKINWRNWWRERKDLLSPVQRFNLFIEEVLLVEIPQKVFIFVDEIDRVLSQSFCLDDFFTLIRLFYNKRVDNSAYQRLTFALLGVATPSDLITDKTQTPFNIGKAIELHGFEFYEALPLAKGLEDKVKNPQLVLQEILNWTGGQPFLTQKICKLIAEEVGRCGDRGDEGDKGDEEEVLFSYFDICGLSPSLFVECLVRQRIIENWEAQDEPEHLKTIRDRLLRNEQKAGRLLGIYQEILQSTLSNDEGILADGSSEQTELRLSGLVVQQQGKLKIYNSIYQQVFNQNWVKKQLEKLRPYSQNFNVWVSSNFQDESRLLRGQALQDALVWANNQSLSTLDYRFLAASQDLEKREFQNDLAVKKEEGLILAKANNTLTQAQRQAKLIISIGSMILAVSIITAIAAGAQLGIARRKQAEANVLLTSIYSQKAFDTSPFQALLEALKAGHKLQDLEKFFPVKSETHQQVMYALRQSVYSIREWNRLDGHQDRVTGVSFSPDGQILASASADHTVKLWNPKNGILLATLKAHTDNVLSLSFSPDGKILASTGDDGTVKLWNVKFRYLIKTFKGHRDRLTSVSFSLDGTMLVCGASDGTVGLLNVDDGKIIKIILAHSEPVLSTSFSPDGKLVASASSDRTLKLWNVSDGSLVKTLTGHRNQLANLSFSPDGKIVATASFDHTIKLWNVADGSLLTYSLD